MELPWLVWLVAWFVEGLIRVDPFKTQNIRSCSGSAIRDQGAAAVSTPVANPKLHYNAYFAGGPLIPTPGFQHLQDGLPARHANVRIKGPPAGSGTQSLSRHGGTLKAIPADRSLNFGRVPPVANQPNFARARFAYIG